MWRVVTCSPSNLYFYPRSVDLISFQTWRITKSSAIHCVMFHMCELRCAFVSKSRNSIPTMDSSYSPDLKAVIKKCLTLNASSRPNAGTVFSPLMGVVRVAAPSPQKPPKRPTRNTALATPATTSNTLLGSMTPSSTMETRATILAISEIVKYWLRFWLSDLSE
jgi:serine/threonine protein kinase